MGKEIERIYKHGQYQISTLSFKAPVCSSLASVPSVREKKQNNSVLGSKNFIQNDLCITNNDDI